MTANAAYAFFTQAVALADLSETRNNVIAQDERVAILAEYFNIDPRRIADQIIGFRLKCRVQLEMNEADY